MGYCIAIGEPELTRHQPQILIHVPLVTHPQAPRFVNDPTGNCNTRRVPYDKMREFAEAVDLTGFFFDDETGLVYHVPGAMRLTSQHVNLVAEARSEFFLHRLSDETLVHYQYLLWFEFWMDWAVKHCRVPAIVNR